MSVWMRAILQIRSVCLRRLSIQSLMCSWYIRYLQYSPETLSIQLPAVHDSYLSPLDEIAPSSFIVYENFYNDPSGSAHWKLSPELRDTSSPKDFRYGLLPNHSDSTCDLTSDNVSDPLEYGAPFKSSSTLVRDLEDRNPVCSFFVGYWFAFGDITTYRGVWWFYKSNWSV